LHCCRLFHRSCAILPKPRHRRGEPVAAAGHGLDDLLVAVAESLAQFAHAPLNRIIGYNHVRPDGPDDFVLRYEAAATFDKVTEDLKGLRAQLDVAIFGSQAAARHIKQECFELEYLRRIHRSYGSGWRQSPVSAPMEFHHFYPKFARHLPDRMGQPGSNPSRPGAES